MAKARKQAITDQKLDQWIKNGLNVMFIGKHGVGKTSIIKQAFDRNNLKSLYLSGSTLDPWVDFVGIPQRVTDPETGETYIELIRPKDIANDEIEAIFIDEYNRSHKKIRNAVMELIQFKSINGKRLKNLKIVWGACNPPDDEELTYDVETVDPAQIDRFQIHVEIPYEPSRQYFTQKYGREVAHQLIVWWTEQTPEAKNLISPRRLEYAADHFFNGNGDINDVLPECSGIARFIQTVRNSPLVQELKNLIQESKFDELREMLADEDAYTQVLPFVMDRRSAYEVCVPLMPNEKISQLVHDDPKIQMWAIQNADKHETIYAVLEDIAIAGTNKELTNKIRKTLNNKKTEKADMAIANGEVNKKAPIYSDGKSGDKLSAAMTLILGEKDSTTHSRRKNYEVMLEHIGSSMTTKEAKMVLDFIESYISNSHDRTVERYFTKTMDVINACVKTYSDNQAKLEFKDNYPKINEYVLSNFDSFYFA